MTARPNLDRGIIGNAGLAAAGGDIVIGDAEGQVGPRHPATARPQRIEAVERALMHEMPVDPQQAGAVLARDHDMPVPDLFKQGQRRFRHGLPPWCMGNLYLL